MAKVRRQSDLQPRPTAKKLKRDDALKGNGNVGRDAERALEPSKTEVSLH